MHINESDRIGPRLYCSICRRMADAISGGRLSRETSFVWRFQSDMDTSPAKTILTFRQYLLPHPRAAHRSRHGSGPPASADPEQPAHRSTEWGARIPGSLSGFDPSPQQWKVAWEDNLSRASTLQ